MPQSVFISYSRLDRNACVQLRKGLENHAIEVEVDEISIDPGLIFRGRIRELLDKCDVTISLVSANSLKSFWVLWEIRDLVEASPTRRFLPVYLDKEFLRDEFVGDVQRQVCERQEALKTEMRARLDRNISVDDLSLIHARLNSLVNDLPTVVRHLRDLCIIDLTPPKFEDGFRKIYKFITGDELSDGSITIVDSLDNASYVWRKHAIEDYIVRNELQEAAAKTMDLLRDFFGNNKDAVMKATRLSGQIRQLSDAYKQEAEKPSPLRIDFLDYYHKTVFDHAEELLRLIPDNPHGAA